MVNMLRTVRSGGQNGADKAGIDAAHALGYSTGGWAPKGWRVKNFDGSDGSNPSLAKLGLKEHESRDYPPRTKLNAEQSDGTAWFGYVDSPGGKLTIRSAKNAGKLVIINPGVDQLKNWIVEHQIQDLNIAGNTESEFNPDIYQATFQVVYDALCLLKQCS